MSGNQSESGTAKVNHTEMIVPRDQADKFVSTLKGYAETCAQSEANATSEHNRAADCVKQCEQLRLLCAEERRNMAECSLNVQTEMRKLDQKTKKHDEFMKENKQVIGSLLDDATDTCNNCKRAACRVDVKESFVQSYVDVAKETEIAIRQKYTRTIYAASISRQVAFSSLKTMEATLNTLHAVHRLSQRTATDISTADMVDNDRPSEPSAKPSVDSMEGDIARLLESVRSLQLDIHNLDRTIQVLDQVSLLDDSVSAACTDPAAFKEGVETTEYKRKQIDLLVRQAMPFDRATYVTVANYEAFILSEVSRRMQSTELNGSALMSGVIQSLKRDGVTAPGVIPKVLRDRDAKKPAGAP